MAAEKDPAGTIADIAPVLLVSEDVEMIALRIGRDDLATDHLIGGKDQNEIDHPESHAPPNPEGTEVIGIDTIVAVEL